MHDVYVCSCECGSSLSLTLSIYLSIYSGISSNHLILWLQNDFKWTFLGLSKTFHTSLHAKPQITFEICNKIWNIFFFFLFSTAAITTLRRTLSLYWKIPWLIKLSSPPLILLFYSMCMIYTYVPLDLRFI